MTMNDRELWRPTRREVISLGIGAFVVSLPIVNWAMRRRLVRRAVPVMGSIAEVAVIHQDEQLAQVAIDAAFERLVWVDQTMSRFKATSDVGRANARAFGQPVSVHAQTAEVLRLGLLWAERTQGRFDPCMGHVVELWDVGNRHRPPPPAEIARCAGRRWYESLEIDRHDNQDVVRFHAPDLALDLGGVAKGYAVDLAVQALRESGIEDGLVNVGGDLYALGTAEDGGPWEAGVRSPTDPTALLTTLPVSNRAIATSGDYEAYFDHGGRRYHHILDPRTAAPFHTESHSVTIAADTCAEADAAATACFGVPGERTRRMLYGRAELVHMA
jgi:thiamine biosynthesis lipoprotein